MNIPNFTAEASLYKINGYQQKITAIVPKKASIYPALHLPPQVFCYYQCSKKSCVYDPVTLEELFCWQPPCKRVCL